MGPASTRTAAGKSSGRTSMVAIATRSWISGCHSRPPRPMISLGTPALSSAAAMGAECLFLRTKTAALKVSPSRFSHCSFRYSATNSRSRTSLSKYANWMSPSPLCGAADSSSTGRSTPSNTPSATELAKSSAPEGLRQEVVNWSFGAGVPGATGKSSTKAVRFSEVAPRHP